MTSSWVLSGQAGERIGLCGHGTEPWLMGTYLKGKTKLTIASFWCELCVQYHLHIPNIYFASQKILPLSQPCHSICLISLCSGRAKNVVYCNRMQPVVRARYEFQEIQRFRLSCVFNVFTPRILGTLPSSNGGPNNGSGTLPERLHKQEYGRGKKRNQKRMGGQQPWHASSFLMTAPLIP